MSHLTFLPVDHSRVILKVSDENGSDYINASHIEVCTGVSHGRIGTVVYHQNYETSNGRGHNHTLHISHHIVIAMQGYGRSGHYIASQGTMTHAYTL